MTQKIHDFNDQIKFGRAGEEKVFQYLNNLEETVIVLDITKHTLFQSLGIDGLLVSDRGKDEQYSWIGFDVKTDYHYNRSGKIFIEVYSDVAKQGGILTTKAEMFFFYDPYGGKMFKVPIYALKQWYNRIGISMEHKKVYNTYGQETSGVVISPEDLSNDGVPIEEEFIGILDVEKIYQNS